MTDTAVPDIAGHDLDQRPILDVLTDPAGPSMADIDVEVDGIELPDVNVRCRDSVVKAAAEGRKLAEWVLTRAPADPLLGMAWCLAFAEVDPVRAAAKKAREAGWTYRGIAQALGLKGPKQAQALVNCGDPEGGGD